MLLGDALEVGQIDLTLTHHSAGGHLKHLLQTGEGGGREVLHQDGDQHLLHRFPHVLVDAGATEPVLIVHIRHTPAEGLKLKVHIDIN